jgi:hypothetical protein
MQSPENVVDRRSAEKQCYDSGLRHWREASKKGPAVAKSAYRFLQINQNYKVSLRVRPKPGPTYQGLSGHFPQMIQR